jgi:hypothetical protein
MTTDDTALATQAELLLERALACIVSLREELAAVNGVTEAARMMGKCHSLEQYAAAAASVSEALARLDGYRVFHGMARGPGGAQHIGGVVVTKR